MDTYRFINSKDIAGHLRDTGHEFSAYEAAYFVERCADATLDEKAAAWREIAETMPDCPAARGHGIGRRESTHGLLRERIDLQRRMLAAFGNGDGCVYFPRKLRYAQWPEWRAGGGKGLWIEDHPRPFSSLEACVARLRAEREAGGDEFDRYVIAKEKIDSDGEDWSPCQNEIVLDGDFRPMEVSVGGLDEHDSELDWGLRDAFVEMPVPFASGDIVIDRTDPRPHPFVFDRLKFWDSSELAAHGCMPLPPEKAEKLDRRVARMDGSHSWDVSHMVACGYELGEDYGGGPLGGPCDLCCDVFGAAGNYLDLERYDGPLEGELKILRLASKFLKGEVDVELAANFSRLIDLEARASRLRASFDGEYAGWARELY